MQAQILAPAAVLIVWTIFILFWMLFARFKGISKIEDKSTLPTGAGARGSELEGAIPDKANWPAHNQIGRAHV